jgi:hypothetical protein
MLIKANNGLVIRNAVVYNIRCFKIRDIAFHEKGVMT